MNKSLVFKNKFYLFFSFVFTFFLFLYLVYFLFNGSRSIFTYYKLNNLNFKHSQKLANLNKENELLVDRIKRLQPNSIDLDFLDEQLRKNTGFSKNNEIIIIFDYINNYFSFFN